MIEVEALEVLPRRELGGPDPDLSAVGLPGGPLALEACGKELLMGPALAARPFRQTTD